MGTDLQSLIISQVRSSLIEVLKKELTTQLLKHFKFLKLPFFNPIIALVVGRLSVFLIDKTILGINLSWIHIENMKELREFEEKKDKLLEALDGDNYEKELKEFDDAAFDLIRLRTKRL